MPQEGTNDGKATRKVVGTGGNNILFTLSSDTINPKLYGKLPFDVEKDFVPISLAAMIPQILVVGGENIAPREIDEALLAHPAVLEAAAVGIPDAEYGQQILACVDLKTGVSCTVDELHAHCLRVLGRYKAPKELRFVAELPKGPSGKVQRRLLIEPAA